MNIDNNLTLFQQVLKYKRDISYLLPRRAIITVQLVCSSAFHSSQHFNEPA